MKTLFIGDLHIGVKNDDPWLQNIQLDFIRQAIEYSKRNGITRWLQTGDFGDTRRAITHKCLEFTRKIVDEIAAAGIKIDVTIGNHDMHFRDKISPNFCSEVLTQFSNIAVYDKPTTLDLDGTAFDMIPWICDENQEEVLEFIKNSKSEYCMGHFELAGFYFYKGIASHGSDPAFLSKYKKVFSGHFHTTSESRNILFLGTGFTITSGDENDLRGFWVFDSETGEHTHIHNTTMWHRRINYPSQAINPNTVKGLAVRVYVDEVDSDLVKYESDLESVVHSLKVIIKQNTVELSEEESDVKVETLTDVIKTYIDMHDVSDVTKQAVTSLAIDLYDEAIKLQ